MQPHKQQRIGNNSQRKKAAAMFSEGKKKELPLEVRSAVTSVEIAAATAAPPLEGHSAVPAMGVAAATAQQQSNRTTTNNGQQQPALANIT